MVGCKDGVVSDATISADVHPTDPIDAADNAESPLCRRARRRDDFVGNLKHGSSPRPVDAADHHTGGSNVRIESRLVRAPSALGLIPLNPVSFSSPA